MHVSVRVQFSYVQAQYTLTYTFVHVCVCVCSGKIIDLITQTAAAPCLPWPQSFQSPYEICIATDYGGLWWLVVASLYCNYTLIIMATFPDESHHSHIRGTVEAYQGQKIFASQTEINYLNFNVLALQEKTFMPAHHGHRWCWCCSLIKGQLL